MELKKLSLDWLGVIVFVCGIALLAISVELLLVQPILELFSYTRNKLGWPTPIIILWFLIIIPSSVSSITVIGFLGGMIGGMFKAKRLYIGFIIASAVGLFHMIILINDNGLFKYSLGRFFLLSAEVPIVILSGGITYHIICKWRINKRTALSK